MPRPRPENGRSATLKDRTAPEPLGSPVRSASSGCRRRSGRVADLTSSLALQRSLQRPAGCEEPRLRRPDGDPEDCADLGQAKAVEVVEDEDRSRIDVEAVEGALES